MDRFHKWIERLDIERADVTKVELSNIGQKTRLVVSHKRGNARFQGIEAEIAKQSSRPSEDAEIDESYPNSVTDCPKSDELRRKIGRDRLDH